MKDTLYVLTKNPCTYFIERLSKELGGLLKILSPWKELEEEVGPHKVLARTSAIYGSDADLSFLKAYFSPENIINPLKSLEDLRTKKCLYEILPELNLPLLPWLNLQEATVNDLLNFTQEEGQYLIKPHRGQGGWGIQSFTREGLFHWFNTNLDKEYLLQPYCPGRECRTFFAGDWSVTLERKGAQLAANFAQGGEASLISPPVEVLEYVKKIQEEFHLYYGAIDFLLHQDQWAILDINLSPGIEQVEKISGENLIQRILTAL